MPKRHTERLFVSSEPGVYERAVSHFVDVHFNVAICVFYTLLMLDAQYNVSAETAADDGGNNGKRCGAGKRQVYKDEAGVSQTRSELLLGRSLFARPKTANPVK